MRSEARETDHAIPDRRVVCRELVVDDDRGVEFLADLTNERLPQRLPLLDLAARELPETARSPVPVPPAGENVPTIEHDGGNHLEVRTSRRVQPRSTHAASVAWPASRHRAATGVPW